MRRSEITVDLVSAVESFKEELEEVNEERQEVLEQAESVEDTSDEKRNLEDRWDNLEARRVQLERKIERFNIEIEELSSTEFTIRELSFGQVQAVKDIVSEQSFDVDIERQSVDGTPLQGVYQAEFMKRSVVDKPPEVDDVMDLADPIGEWLWNKIDAFNTSGDEDMGNMSLDEAMNSKN
jgi:Sec-independent protein translocase protein TatA